jgi:alcohol/geraniol dehydrogenase (NADP+)
MQIKSYAAYGQGEPLKLANFDSGELHNYDCLIKVLSCGICYSDLRVIHNNSGPNSPVVAGHEVVGEIVELGAEVHHLKIGERVGVGWQSAACLQCRDCLKGNENLCSQRQALIIHGRGGFAEYLKVDSRFAFPIPDGIATESAGPLLCGGITVYAGLRYGGMTSGQEIGIIGIGGLGHLAVQFASRLGNNVTVFTTSEDKADFAHKLGATHVVLTTKGQPLPKPKRGLDLILSTVPQSLDWAAYLDYLNTDSTLMIVGMPSEPLVIPLSSLLFQRRRIMASPVGGRAMIMEMLSIADRFDIKPIIEVFSLENINEAIAKVQSNQIRYRAVLKIAP